MGWDDRGFPTTRTEPIGWETMSKSYDEQGFLITSTSTSTPITAAATAGGSLGSYSQGLNGGVDGKVAGTSTSTAEAAKQTSAWSRYAILGVAAAVAEGMLL